MNLGYCRVSTIKQLSGNSIEDQKEQLTAAGVTEFFVDCYTGTEKDRPQLTELLKRIQAGDTVFVTKLDRLARSALDGLQIVDQILEAGASIQILNMGTFDNSPIGKLTRTILLAFAEYERDMIRERMESGKAIARSNGVRVDGRPLKFSKQQRDHAVDLLDSGKYSYTDVERMTGMSRSTLIREKRKRVAEQMKGGTK